MQPLHPHLAIRLESVFFMLIGLIYILFPHIPGQSYLFIGSEIPFGLPWKSAPFREYVTQPGLEECWPKVLMVLRVVGGLYLLVGIVVGHFYSLIDLYYQRHLEYEQKRGKRGSVVHEKIEKIERQTNAEAASSAANKHGLPPLWILAIVHLALAGANQYLYRMHPWGLEFAKWSATTATFVHLLFAISMVVNYSAAKKLWRAVEQEKRE